MKNMKFVTTLLMSIILTFSSCNFNSKKAENNDLQSLTFGVMSSMDYLPLAVAKREGYFDKYGVDVAIQKFMSANERDIAFQGNAVDGGITDFTSAAILKNAGYDMQLTSKCQAPFYIVAGKNSGIDELKDLKGKKVSVSQNTVIDFCVDMALKSVGLTESDVEKIEINKIPVRFQMLQTGQIDATGLPNPFGLIAQKEGDKLIVKMEDLGYAVTGIVFSEEAIKNKSNAIESMYKAYNDGVEYMKTHSIDDIKDILEKDLNFPPHVISEVVITDYTPAQGINPSDKDIVEVIEWLKNKEVIANTMQPQDILNNQFVK